MHILIVEDDVDTRDMYCDILKMIDLDPAAVGTSNEAIAALQGPAVPDILLLDLTVPGMPIEEFHAQLKANLDGAKTKLILISGADSLHLKAQELGAWSFLRKPFGVEELIATVKQALTVSL